MAEIYRIIGEQRPIAGTPYTYALNIPTKCIRWEVRYGLTVVDTKPIGVFTFLNKSLGREFTICAYYNSTPELGILTERCAVLRVKPLPRPPNIVTVVWQDVNFKDIRENDRVKYLDDIYLVIRTINIPPGDPIAVKIWDKELYYPLLNHRAVGILHTQVNENGVALLKISPTLLKRFAKDLNDKDFCNQILHRYFAEIFYYGQEIPDENQVIVYETGKPPKKKLPKMDVTVKSKILQIENMADRTVEPQNSQKSLVVDGEDISEKKDPVKVKINVYFDGTMGNKYNVELFENDLLKKKPDLSDTEFEVQGDGRWTLKKKGSDSDILKDHGRGSEGTSSYKQVLTNIENLYTLDLSKSTNREIKIYIEGVGSIPYGKDEVFFGAALGWAHGINSKIGKAMSEILKEVSNIIKDDDVYISEAEVSAFGFSRGAATARSFVSKRGDIALHAQTSEMNVFIPFVGLFDTVSSVTNFRSDVDAYDLKVGVRAEKVVQLTAGDEYRGNFALTTIDSSVQGGVGYELELPGDHSDIGGGHKNYHLEQDEQGLDYPVPGLIEKVQDREEFVDKLIEQGWFRKETKKIITQRFRGGSGRNPDSYYDYTKTNASVERIIWNEYRYIPLAIMLDFAKKYGKIKFDEGVQQEKYSVKSIDLLPVKEILHNFALSHDGAHSISAYDQISGLLLKNLRNQYLHLSASREGGHYSVTDRISGTGKYDKSGNPDRERIEG